MENGKKNDIERIDQKIGIYAITGVSMLIYIFWMSLESASTLATVTLIIDLVWYCYSQRLLSIYIGDTYSKNYTINYMVCVYGCAAVYILNIPIFYRIIIVLLLGCEGFIRTLFIEIRKLIKESKELESKVDE